MAKCWYRHIWKVVNKDEYDSALDSLLKAGLTSTQGESTIPCGRLIIYTIRCESCGTERLKEYRG